MPGRWRTMAAVLAVACAAGFVAAAEVGSHSEPASNKSDLASAEGTWIVADSTRPICIQRQWNSVLKIKDGKFSLSHFWGTAKTLTGSLKLNQSTSPNSVDFNVDPLDLQELQPGLHVAKCMLPGIYKLENDQLTVSFQNDRTLPRPKNFDGDRGALVFTFARAGANFHELPEEVAALVTDAAGKPIAGARLYAPVDFAKEELEKSSEPSSHIIGTTGLDGTAKVLRAKLGNCLVAARNASGKLIGYSTVSPASVLERPVRVTLQTACRIRGKIFSTDMEKAGKKIDRIAAMLGCDGWQVGLSNRCDFEFDVPPGSYHLNILSEDLKFKRLDINVSGGIAELTLPPIDVPAINLIKLIGHEAPELERIIAWRGKPVRLADLRGKIVLVEFWGTWCHWCIQSMPMMIALDEQFKDKGLAIVGVHVNYATDIDAGANYDREVARLSRELWHGKAIPFPVALTIDRRDLKDPIPNEVYGIDGFPTTLVIDRNGKLLGTFKAREEKAAVAEVEKLLDSAK